MKQSISFSELEPVKQAKHRRRLIDLTLELTARCNNKCRHCYNNLPEDDSEAARNELSTEQIKAIADQAFEMGALRMLLTGGEVLLRQDFSDIYTYLKQKGFVVSVFTNASLISQDHINLFKQYPPASLEITVYGTSDREYAKITGTRNFAGFKSGIGMLASASIPFTLKAMVLKSNLFFLDNITRFCRNISWREFRYDPFLTLRTDRNGKKNKKIIQERLSPHEIAALEKHDPARLEAVKKMEANAKLNSGAATDSPEKLFRCNAGKFSCFISYDGFFRLCRPLVNKKCIYDLKQGTLKHAWETFAPDIIEFKSFEKSYHENCGTCMIRNLCMWCPASADLETGQLDGYVKYFCEIAKKRHAICLYKIQK